MDAGEFLQLLNSAVFLLLAVAAGVRWYRVRGAAPFWFALTFLILAWVTTSGRVTDYVGHEPELLRRFSIALLAVFPFALYRFVACFRPAGAIERRVVGTVLVLLVLWALLTPELPGEGESGPLSWQIFIWTFIAHWVAMLLLTAARLWRAGRSEPNAARRRIWMLGLGAVLLTAALVLAGVAGSVSDEREETLRILARLAALASAIVFYLGYFTPYVLRVLWRVPEELALRQAVAGLIRASDVEQLANPLLPAVCGMTGGRAAALLSRDGEIYGTHQTEERDLATLRGDNSPLHSQAGMSQSEVQIAARHLEADDTYLVASFPAGHLVVWTTPFTPFFGDEEIALLRSLGAVVDLSLDHVQLVERERETSRRLRDVNELKNEFVAMVAHDLRSPMTVISGFVDTIINRWDTIPDEEKLDYLRMVSSNTKSLAELVEDVLQVARIESGEFSYELARFDLRRTIERTIAELGAAYGDRRFDVDVPAELPSAWGDEERNWQVLTNLLSNAVKFSPSDSPVEVRVRPSGSELEVAVRDHGQGIRPEDHSRLFQKFSRLESASDVKGTGLGLYICKSLVEAQGGRIWVESKPDVGTTFVYTVPMAPADHVEAQG